AQQRVRRGRRGLRPHGADGLDPAGGDGPPRRRLREVADDLPAAARRALRRRDRPGLRAGRGLRRGSRDHGPRPGLLRVAQQRRRDPAAPRLVAARPLRLAGGELLLPAGPPEGAGREGQVAADGRGKPGLGGPRYLAPRRPRGADGPQGPSRSGGRVDAGGGDEDRPGALPRRRRRREQPRAPAHGRAGRRPRVRLRLAHPGRRPARGAGLEPDELAALRSCAPDHDSLRWSRPQALGVHAAARGEHRGTQHRRDRLAAAGALGQNPGEHDAREAHGVQVRGPLGGVLAAGEAAARRRRRPPHAAFCRAGDVLGPQGRRQPLLEARPRPPREGLRRDPEHLRVRAPRQRPPFHRLLRRAWQPAVRHRPARGLRAGRADDRRAGGPVHGAPDTQPAAQARAGPPARGGSAGGHALDPRAGAFRRGDRPVRRRGRERMDGAQSRGRPPGRARRGAAGVPRRTRRAPGKGDDVGRGARRRNGRRPGRQVRRMVRGGRRRSGGGPPRLLRLRHRQQDGRAPASRLVFAGGARTGRAPVVRRSEILERATALVRRRAGDQPSERGFGKTV
ncbi:MAG: 2-polyprenyl-6-methoxyphenol hydroxylase and related FAD-dependent oxidoreductases, partial [uncultured Rubrobacteraceae bacterium]